MTNLTTNCPICDGEINLPKDLEESEIITCDECKNRVVVSSIAGSKVILEEAPEIEEDWGE